MIGIIYIGHIKRAPYLAKYTKILEANNIKYDIIYWNRGSDIPKKNSHEKHSAEKIFEYNLKSKEQRAPIKKIKDFLKFRHFVKRTIKERKYQKLIVLTTMSALIIADKLISSYKEKFIFDYRDASFEYNVFFKTLLEIIFKKASNVVISSEGFKEILPLKVPYTINHNVNLELLTNNMNEVCAKNKKYPLRVSFIGGLRESDYMEKMMKIFSRDSNFALYFHGGGENYNELKQKAASMKNVFFTGAYKEEDKVKLIEQSDLLLYNYPKSFNNNVALANKYYDSLIWNKPLIANEGTFSGRLIVENELGIALDMEDPCFLEKLLCYYKGFDEKAFSMNASKELIRIKIDEENFRKIVESFLN